MKAAQNFFNTIIEQLLCLKMNVYILFNVGDLESYFFNYFNMKIEIANGRFFLGTIKHIIPPLVHNFICFLILLSMISYVDKYRNIDLLNENKKAYTYQVRKM